MLSRSSRMSSRSRLLRPASNHGIVTISRVASARIESPFPIFSTTTTTSRKLQFPQQQQHRLSANPLLTVARLSSSATTTAAASTSFSTTTTTTAPTATSAKPAPVRDFFLDNLGKIFLGIIAGVIGSLVRSSYGTSNMKAVRDTIEEVAALDPLEIDELRKANTELDPDLFRTIVRELLLNNHNNDTATMMMSYPEFVLAVRTILHREKGDGCTIGMGFLLDRVVIAALKEKQKRAATSTTTTTNSAEESSFSSDSSTFGSSEQQSQSQSQSSISSSNNDSEITMPLSFWLAVLSLALNGPVPDRIRLLYEVLELSNSTTTTSNTHDGETETTYGGDNNNSNSNDGEKIMPGHTSNDNDDNNTSSGSGSNNDKVPHVKLQDVIAMVGYLQDTCQLVPDTQVVPTETKYPTQQYRRGTPEELVQWDAAAAAAAAATSSSESSSNASPTNYSNECLDLDAFAGILRSRSVCAWGECYHKKKYVP